VDWAPHPNEGDKVLYVFDGDELDPGDLAALRLDPAELAEYAFHTVEEATGVLVPRLARRVAAAVRGRRDGLTLYLEHGQEPPDGTPQITATSLDLSIRSWRRTPQCRDGAATPTA
jgi:hypothetical protein